MVANWNYFFLKLQQESWANETNACVPLVPLGPIVVLAPPSPGALTLNLHRCVRE